MIGAGALLVLLLGFSQPAPAATLPAAGSPAAGSPAPLGSERILNAPRWPVVGLLAASTIILVLGAGLLHLARLNRALRRHEAVLAASEARLRSLLGNVPCAFYRCALDADWTAHYVSGNIEVITGYPADDFLQRRRNRMAIIHPDDAGRVEREIQAHAKQGLPYALEYRILDATGNTRWLLDHGRAQANRQGDIRWLDGVILDISALKLAEDKLRQAAVVFDNTTQGIVVTDASARILRVNRAFCDISGYAEGELVGNDPSMLRSGRHDAAFFSALWRSLAKVGYWQGEIWNRRKNGEVYPTWQSISVLHGAGGDTAGYISLYTDISPFKQHEEQLQRLAYHDPLTGLPNRILFDERLEHAIGRAARRGERLALLYLDLDKFKSINDNLGHQVGDELLEAIGERLSSRLRKSDTLSRRGGDEFTLLIDTFTDLRDIRAIAEEILQQMLGPFQLPSGHRVETGCSIGISLFPEDGDDTTTLIRCADAAMYRAKDEGGQRYCFFAGDIAPK